MADSDLVRAVRTVTAMTELEEGRTKRRPFTWSIEAWGNRFAYALVVAIVAQVALGSEPLSLSIGVAFFLLLTGIVYFRHWGYEGTDRQP